MNIFPVTFFPFERKIMRRLYSGKIIRFPWREEYCSPWIRWMVDQRKLPQKVYQVFPVFRYPFKLLNRERGGALWRFKILPGPLHLSVTPSTGSAKMDLIHGPLTFIRYISKHLFKENQRVRFP